MDPEEAANEIAPLVYAIVQKLNETQDESLKKYLRHIIYEMGRQMERFGMAEVSVAARDYIRQKAPDIDLRNRRWGHQQSFDPGRKKLHYEHMVPCSQIRDACEKANSVELVAYALAQSRIAWITKEEDEALTKAGFRSRRESPKTAYATVGIKLCNDN